MDKKNDVLVAISAREAEIWGYDLNIAVYERLLKKIFEDQDFPDAAAQTAFSDDIKMRLIAEKIERRKAFLVKLSLEDLLRELE